MDKYTASNGATVNETAYPGFKMLTVKTPDNTITLAGVHVDALREFFQAERDEELGRWRWPRNPDYVVYPREDGGGHVLNERTADVTYRNGLGVHDMEGAVAKEYRDAHPERKPWHDAKPGEVWAIKEAGQPERAYLVDDTQFYDSSRDYALNFDDSVITDARCIWPEAS